MLRAAVLNVAVPPASVPVPNVVAPSLKVTVPLGVPAAVDDTVAVNVTEAPECSGSVKNPVPLWSSPCPPSASGRTRSIR